MISIGPRAKPRRIGTLKSPVPAIRTGRPSLSAPAGLPRGTERRRNDEPLGDFAYRVLRDMIRAGKIRPREHLREAEVAKWLNISRTPVREAFHRSNVRI